MLGVLFAERAVLGHGKPVGVVTLILVAVVISVLAFGAFERDFSPCRSEESRVGKESRL